MAEATSNPDMIQRTRALAAFSSAKEYSSIQRAVLAAALPASNTTTGKLSPNDRLYAESALESQKSEIRSFKSIYGEDAAAELLKPIEDGGNSTIKATDTVRRPRPGLRERTRASWTSGPTATGWTTAPPRSSR